MRLDKKASLDNAWCACNTMETHDIHHLRYVYIPACPWRPAAAHFGRHQHTSYKNQAGIYVPIVRSAPYVFVANSSPEMVLVSPTNLCHPYFSCVCAHANLSVGCFLDRV